MINDEFNLDELCILQSLINEFINAFNNKEYAYSENLPEYQASYDYTQEVGFKLKAKIRQMAIECDRSAKLPPQYSNEWYLMGYSDRDYQIEIGFNPQPVNFDEF